MKKIILFFVILFAGYQLVDSQALYGNTYTFDNSGIANNDGIICSGSYVRIKVVPIGGVAPYTFLWSNNGTTDEITEYPTLNKVYWVKITDATGANTVISTEEIKVLSLPYANTYTFDNSGLYANDAIICAGDNVKVKAIPVSGVPPFTFVWNTNETTDQISHNPMTDTIYSVRIWDSSGSGCPSSVNTEIIDVNPKPNVVISSCSGSFNLCGNGDQIKLTAVTDASPDDIVWFDGTIGPDYYAHLPGNYFVTVTKNGCDSYTSVNVTSTPAPIADFSYSGDASSGFYHFENHSQFTSKVIWVFGDDGTTASDFGGIEHIFPVGKYWVTLIAFNECGERSEKKALVEVLEPHTAPTADFSFSVSGSCIPVTVQFSDHSTYSSQWSWTFDGGSPATSSQANPVVTFNSAGSHKVTLVVTNQFGSNTKIDYVAVGSSPVVDFTVVPNGLSVSVYANVPGAVHYEYNFGDGGKSNHPNESHTYAAGGTWTITLAVTTACGTFFVSHDAYVECMYMVLSYDNNWGYPGDQFNFHVDAPGNASNVIFTWSVQGGQIVGIDLHNPQTRVVMNQTGWVEVVGEKYDEFGQEIVCTQIARVPIEIFGTTANNDLLDGDGDPVKVFPNPAQDVVNVSIPNGNYDVMLIDDVGRILCHMSETKDFTISVKDIPSGNYLIHISEGERLSTKWINVVH